MAGRQSGSLVDCVSRQELEASKVKYLEPSAAKKFQARGSAASDGQRSTAGAGQGPRLGLAVWRGIVGQGQHVCLGGTTCAAACAPQVEVKDGELCRVGQGQPIEDGRYMFVITTDGAILVGTCPHPLCTLACA